MALVGLLAVFSSGEREATPRGLQPRTEGAARVGQKEGRGVGRESSDCIYVHAVAIRQAVLKLASDQRLLLDSLATFGKTQGRMHTLLRWTHNRM